MDIVGIGSDIVECLRIGRAQWLKHTRGVVTEHRTSQAPPRRQFLAHRDGHEEVVVCAPAEETFLRRYGQYERVARP